MQGHTTGKVVQPVSKMQHRPSPLIFGSLSVGKSVDVGFGQAEGLADFPNDGSKLVRRIGAEQGDVVVAREQVAGDFRTVGPGKIQVKVRRRSAVYIDESLKVQIEFNGINIRYLKYIRHNAIGATPPSNMVKPAALRVPDQVPVNQKIGIESLGLNGGQLLLYPLPYFARGLGVALRQEVLAQLPEQLDVVLRRFGVGLQVGRSSLGPHGKRNGTAFQQSVGSLNQYGSFLVGLFPLRPCHPNFPGIARGLWSCILQKCILPDSAEYPVGLEIVGRGQGEGHPSNAPVVVFSPFFGGRPNFPGAYPNPRLGGDRSLGIPWVNAGALSGQGFLLGKYRGRGV